MRLLLILLLTLLASSAEAHPLAPLGLKVKEAGDHVEVSLKRPRVQARGASFSVRVPSGCTSTAPEQVVSETTDAAVTRQTWQCEGTLVGRSLGVDGLSDADVDAVVEVQLADGHVVHGLLDEDASGFVVTAKTPRLALARDFAEAGLLHLAVGLDHLLLLLGLVLLLRRPRAVAWALTAFTLGHAMSLCAAVLGWVSVPSRYAEIAIAVTLVWLAHRLLQDEKSQRSPYAPMLGIGLIHGLGFASAFSASGLAGGDLAVALGAFHLGIELGQLALVVVALLALRFVSTRRRIAGVAAYAMGSIAVMWILERATGAFAGWLS